MIYLRFCVRVFGPPNNPLFEGQDQRGGRYAQFAAFDSIPEEVRALALSYDLLGEVVTNGYRLGVHPALNYPEVQVKATGNRVAFTTLTLDSAVQVWNDHAEGIAEWLEVYGQPYINMGDPFRISAYGPESSPLLSLSLGDGRARAYFDDVADVPAWLTQADDVRFVVVSYAPPNFFMPGMYSVREGLREGHQATVIANGRSVRVASPNLAFAIKVVSTYLGAVGKDSPYVTEAQNEFLQLRRFGKMG